MSARTNRWVIAAAIAALILGAILSRLFLVNTAVQAACAAVHKTPPPSPTAWLWRLIGAMLFEWNFFIRHLYNPHRNGERIAHPECRKILTLLNTS